MLKIYNCDCIEGAKKYLANEEIDLLIADPPFGIKGNELDKHYNRNESCVLSGYTEAPDDYYNFSLLWLEQAKRTLKNNGSMYIVSGWSNLDCILNAIKKLELYVTNHIIWKFSFGVYCRNKFVTSHYHILYLKKSKKTKPTFNTHCRFSPTRDQTGSPLYRDMEDVWTIPKEYHPGKLKNKNKLPGALIKKMVDYSSNPGDVVGDFFLGNFTTAQVAIKMNRHIVGFEINSESFICNLQNLSP